MARQRRAGGGVDQLPSGRYRVRIVTTDGRRVSLGTFPTKRAAEATYARSLTQQADGKVVAPRQRGTTLGEYAPRWVESRLTTRGEPLRQRVRELYLEQLEHHILPTLGDVPLDRLDTATVRRWVVHVRGPSGPGVSTAAKCYRLLRSIMATAVEDGLALTNPCTIKGAGTEPKPETEIPTVAEVHELADCIDERLRSNHLAGTLAAATGAGTKELMYRLGHASPRAALIYQHATRERDIAISEAMNHHIAQ
jgi:integrase